MRALVIADQETDILWGRFDKARFSNVDIVIACGDLKPAYLTFLVTMLPVPVLYVYGNHDRRYAPEDYQGCTCIDGSVFTYRGIRFMGLGGVCSAAPKPHHYSEAQMRRRIRRLMPKVAYSGGFDVLVTHSAPQDVGDGEGYHKGFACFRELMDVFKPAYCFHGHQHLNYAPMSIRCRQYGSTQVVNGFGWTVVELPEHPAPRLTAKAFLNRWKDAKA